VISRPIPGSRRITPALRTASGYAITFVLSLLIAFVVLQLWRADLRVPFMYDGDGLSTSVQVKGMIENGWFWQNPAVGAPGGLDMRDFPTPDILQPLIMKLIAIFIREYSVVMNVYYLLTFALTAMSSLWVLRRWGVSFLPALAVSELYAFLPYHIQKTGVMGQLYLASYFLVPLVIWLAVGSTRVGFISWRRQQGDTARRGIPRLVGALALCVGLGIGGVYYAYFGCLLLLAAGLYGWARTKDVRVALSVATLIVVVVAGGFAAVSPTVISRLQHGVNADAVQRAPVEADLFGLKIDQLLLPVEQHRIPIFARLKYSYLAGLRGWAPWLAITENVSLGTVGATGFLALVAWLLFLRGSSVSLGRRFDETLDRLSSLLGAGLVVTVVGGLGGLIGYVLPGIRANARIVVYVAFMSLAVVAMALEWLRLRAARTFSRRWGFWLLLVAVVGFGLADQVPSAILPDYDATRSRWTSDAEMVSGIERQLPEGAMVFQLPYMRFPESPPPYPGTMNDYDLFRGYLHSDRLRWSYGSMKGRPNDLWVRRVSSEPVPEMLRQIREKGFTALWIDLDGYPDRGTALLTEVRASVGVEPSLSADRRVAVFVLR
jgi:phosphoglycerol transferase